MTEQQQFLNVIDRDEAERRFRRAIDLGPLGAEAVPLAEALGRVLAEDVVARVDVPSFDRSNYDGYAVRAADSYGAAEEAPRRLRAAGRSACDRRRAARRGRAGHGRVDRHRRRCSPAAPTPW